MSNLPDFVKNAIKILSYGESYATDLVTFYVDDKEIWYNYYDIGASDDFDEKQLETIYDLIDEHKNHTIQIVSSRALQGNLPFEKISLDFEKSVFLLQNYITQTTQEL